MKKAVKWGTQSHALQALRATATNQINVDRYASPEHLQVDVHHVAGSYGGDDDEQNGNHDVLRETIVFVFAFEHLVVKLVVHVVSK